MIIFTYVSVPTDVPDFPQTLYKLACFVSGGSFSIYTEIVVLTKASKRSEQMKLVRLFLMVSGLLFAGNVVTTPERKHRCTYGCRFTQDWHITGHSHSKVCPFMLPSHAVHAVCRHV